MKNKELMTKEELECVTMAGKLFNKYIKLPVEHCMAAEEVASAIHVIQYAIMSRPIRRAYGWANPNEVDNYSIKMKAHASKKKEHTYKTI